MAKNELLPFANGEDANVLPTNQWEALTDIIENGFQSGIARSEQVNRVLAQGAVASYVLGQLIVDQLNKDATLDKDTLYQNLVSALQENAKDVCLPLSGGNVTGNLTVQSKNVVRSVNGTTADASGNVNVSTTNFMPNYSSGVTVSLASVGSGYTAPSDGVFYFTCLPAQGGVTIKVYINNVEVGIMNYVTGYSIQPIGYYMSKGDVFKVPSLNQNNALYSGRFFPLKGA